MDLQLSGKKAFVSGSDRGTGQIIAETLAKEGVQVIIHSNVADASTEVANSINLSQPAGQAIAVWGDITTDSGADQVAQQIEAHLGCVDILINNYGSASPGYWTKTSTEKWLEAYQVNVLSATRMIQRLTGPMKTQGWGRVIQLGTIGSKQPNSIMPHYYAAKGALATLTVSLAKELANTGISVNTVSPGLILTPELKTGYLIRGKKKGWGDTWEEILPKIIENDFPNPTGRIATRQEVADLVTYLSSPKADFINGQDIRIDGGAVRLV